MSDTLAQWAELYDIESKFALRITVIMILGGILGWFVRQLYRRFSSSVSNRDNFSSLFPLLIITTILVITVVKSSLALSLGLVGALSIVRFRAAIKDPEELIYLFFCIAVGVALGADLPLIGIVGVVVFTGFVASAGAIKNRGKRHNLLLTIIGDSKNLSADGENGIHETLKRVVGEYRVQRFDAEEGQAQLRAIIAPENQEAIMTIMTQLQEQLPGCEVSYVNLDTLV